VDEASRAMIANSNQSLGPNLADCLVFASCSGQTISSGPN